MSIRSVTNDVVCGHFAGVDSNMRCLLHENSCCGCTDKRSPSMGFVKSSGVKHGVPETTYLFRWGFYCHRCKDYWTNRLLKAPPGWSLDFPHRLIDLMNSTPPPAERSTSSNTRGTSTNTPTISSFSSIEHPSIPSSSNDLPLAVAAPGAGRDIPVTIAPPPTNSSTTPSASVPSAPPPITSNTAPWVSIFTPQLGPPQAGNPPGLSKSARKKAAKRARAAAQEQQRQRVLDLQAIRAIPLPDQNNVPPPGAGVGALPIPSAPAPAPLNAPRGPRAANTTRPREVSITRGVSPPSSSQQQPQTTTDEAPRIANFANQFMLSQNLSYREQLRNSSLQPRGLPQPQSVSIYTGTESQNSNPLQTRLGAVHNAVAEAEPQRFGLGYNTGSTSRPGERINYGWGNYMEAATPRPVRHSPEPGNYGSGVRHMSPARLLGLLDLGEDDDLLEAYDDDDDEWEPIPPNLLRQEPAPTTVLRNATPQAPPPLSEEMRQLAEETSIILELIGKTDLDDNLGMDSDYKQIIDDAYENIHKIRTQYRVALALKAGSAASPTQDPEPTAEDTLKIDSACIICCDEVSDTVLLPCNHLVLCMMCSDKMGIKGRCTPGARTVPCPICRRLVLDRIKIFRG